MKQIIEPSRTRRIFILVDSSTKGTQTSKYGKSSVCWAAFANSLEGTLMRVGLIYCNYNEGPNKIFYIGVIRALEDCLFIGDENCVFEVLGDCEPVIGQLNKSTSVDDMAPFYKQVKGLEAKYKKLSRGQILYRHISKDDKLYRKIDKCAKDMHNFVKQRLGPKN